jgi:hypothetical protein
MLKRMETLSALWRRLDVPGHDACRFEQHATGCQIAGTAIFEHQGVPAHLEYEVVCDATWHTRGGTVRGFVGTQLVQLAVERTPAGEWLLDGRTVPGLEDCVHLDFGFTPATNFAQLRQVALQVQQSVAFSVAWLDVPDGTELALLALPQHYERRSATSYWYESPTVGYAELLELTDKGIIVRYPGLWELETSSAG